MARFDKNNLPTTEQLSSELKRIRYIKEYRRMLSSTISSLLVVAALAVLISMLFLPVLRVTGTSMAPSFANDELVICNKRGNFKNGDVVAFYFNNKILLKRVIGLPGDVIDISEDGKVFLNGEPLDEPYVNELAFGECDISLPYQVPESRLFLMGDNRQTSIDSRSTTIGAISNEFVIGKVFFCIYPFESFGKV